MRSRQDKPESPAAARAVPAEVDCPLAERSVVVASVRRAADHQPDGGPPRPAKEARSDHTGMQDRGGGGSGSGADHRRVDRRARTGGSPGQGPASTFPHRLGNRPFNPVRLTAGGASGSLQVVWIGPRESAPGDGNGSSPPYAEPSAVAPASGALVAPRGRVPASSPGSMHSRTYRPTVCGRLSGRE